VQPDIVAARSGGEFAAEFARGTIALEDAMEVACRISGFIRAGRGAGRMLAIRAGLSATQHLERSSPVRFSIVADADDDVTILACETNAIEPFQRFLIVHQIDYRVLASAIAPHGPLIDEWKSDLLKPLSGGTSHSALVPYYSAGAQGRDDTGCYSARLWRAVREPALVGRMLDSLIADGGNIFLEIGGQPMLAPRIQRRAAAAGKEVVTLPRQRSDSLPALMDESEDILRKSRVFSAAARSGSIADRARTPTSLDRSQGARQR
jgi:acyl transferase domain-containing protein